MANLLLPRINVTPILHALKRINYTNCHETLLRMESISSNHVQLHLGMACKTNKKTHL